MGRTVPSYRRAAAREIRKWKIFREQLDKSERKSFDEMMAYPHIYNAGGIMACKTVLIQPILMSIIFGHYKQLDNIQKSIEKTKVNLYIACAILITFN